MKMPMSQRLAEVARSPACSFTWAVSPGKSQPSEFWTSAISPSWTSLAVQLFGACFPVTSSIQVFASRVQVALQPSPATVPPSSQASPLPTMLLPHVAARAGGAARSSQLPSKPARAADAGRSKPTCGQSLVVMSVSLREVAESDVIGCPHPNAGQGRLGAEERAESDSHLGEAAGSDRL